MVSPRLIATDLDGTALRSDGTVSPRTAAAFARVEQAGALLVFVTGRPPRWIGEVAEAVRYQGLAICANGALVYDLHTERVVESHLIGPEVLSETVARLRHHLPDLSFSVEYERGFAHEAGFTLRRWDAPEGTAPRVGASTLLSEPCAKLLAFHQSMDPDSLHVLVNDLVGDLVTATRSSGKALIEMSAQGVTKASALAALARHHLLGPGEVVAFGDMPNDLPMLAWAGTSYAVANAHPDVLAAVTHVTAANDEDGVAVVLEELFDRP
ncbi:hydrolase [Sphaerisporangium siamense]|uniref:Cof subfamily protein (Haloacid dehalogenase superfamily) n=1 Tax=Sphaerisporangium siamense TaxID=795645 RepID=A0A7W7D487_9ACTN|nr:Cof-type HAD-IIB family hydrolase [Sphaerisporangium siamense]MBB4700022.1 Cof subfamily protein (haloacid dehalogenase superfamily) [Sphaerisporangium siamense]GII84660.1 hydrolase [Sphaerisporangium siamense]